MKRHIRLRQGMTVALACTMLATGSGTVSAAVPLGESSSIQSEQTVEEKNLYQKCSRSELKFILRYHSEAIMGVLRGWTEEDTKNLDRIVHQIYVLLVEGVSPYS